MRLGLLALLALSTGCYSYGRVESGELASQDIVRLELSDQGTVNATPALGTYVQFVEGEVVQAGSSGVALNVTSLRRRGETLYREWPGDRVQFPAADIRSVTRRTRDKGKTTAAVVGASSFAIATIVVVAKSTGLFSGSGGKTVITNGRPR